ncbi:MAG: ribose 1,5-bisphosphate isomerase [Candidatus Bathyarchaeota archaeon]
MSKLIPEVKNIARDIKSMKIRGAGKIARAAAKAIVLTVKHSEARNIPDFLMEIEEASRLLLSTRPTAVSLPNTIKFVMKHVLEAKGRFKEINEIKSYTIDVAENFIQESKDAVKKIGEIGARRINKGDVLLTHCNSQTAIEVIKTAWAQNKKIKVFVTETRPRFQGRVTAKILGENGIPTVIVVDSAVRYIMNKVDKVVVGADAVAANGAVVNKIGTSTIALAAKEARTPFFVAAETFKFDPDTSAGELITIEERDSSEVISKRELEKLSNIKVFNPSFDITPPEYIDLIITEKGVIPPQAAISVIQQEFGWTLFERTGRLNIIEEE